jgi:hypothetical protein
MLGCNAQVAIAWVTTKSIKKRLNLLQGMPLRVTTLG